MNKWTLILEHSACPHLKVLISDKFATKANFHQLRMKRHPLNGFDGKFVNAWIAAWKPLNSHYSLFNKGSLLWFKPQTITREAKGLTYSILLLLEQETECITKGIQPPSCLSGRGPKLVSLLCVICCAGQFSLIQCQYHRPVKASQRQCLTNGWTDSYLTVWARKWHSVRKNC